MRVLGHLVPVKRFLPVAILSHLRKARNRARFYCDKVCSVDKTTFRNALCDLGPLAGEIVYVRSSYDDMRSIQASPLEIIEILCELVGSSGTLVMPTYPMTGRSQHYLDRQPVFDWRRTPSRSGLLTEIFRRMPGTERSIHPTHPIAARGTAARWLTEGHELSTAPFDEHSPYQKLLKKNALILSMGCFHTMALHHLADHLIQGKIPYPIYSDRAAKVAAIGKDGIEHLVTTRAHHPKLDCVHRTARKLMIREGFARAMKVGRVPLTAVRVRSYVKNYERYYAKGLIRHRLVRD